MRTLVLALTVLLYALPSESAEPEAPWSAEADLKALQGRWQVTSAIGEITELSLGKQGALQIDGNRATIANADEAVVIANDLPLATQQNQVFKGSRLILFTLADGKGLLGSYQVRNRSLVIRYPYTCRCSRSGTTIMLERTGE